MVPQSQAAVGAGFFGTDKARRNINIRCRFFYLEDEFNLSDTFIVLPFFTLTPPRSYSSFAPNGFEFTHRLLCLWEQAYVMPTDASGEGEGDEDMLEEQRKRKRKADKEKDGKKSKKYSDFKF